MTELPASYAEARPRLGWVVRRRFTPANLVRAARNGPPWFGVIGPSVGWLDVRLVLDGALHLTYVQQRHLHLWGVDADTALADGMGDVAGLEPAVGLFGAWEGFAAAPSTDLLLVDDDLDRLLDRALEAYEQADDPLSPMVFARTSRGIAPLPPTGAHADRVRAAALIALARVYDDQAEVLLEELDEGTVLAGLTVAHRAGRPVSVARYVPGSPTLLPRADLVRIGDALLPFEALAVEPVAALDPPRYRVRG